MMTTFATKTPLLKETISRLNAFNDQLCYFTFVEESFEQRLTEVDSSEQDLYTPQVFRGNSRAHRIHVKINELSDFRQATQSATFGAFASASYETIASYMKEALNLLRRMGVSQTTFEAGDKVEESLQSAIQEAGCKPVDQNVIEALTYFRLRRNQVVHLRAEPVETLKTLVRYSGPRLNNYWHTREALDFKQVPGPELGELEVIDFIKLLRVCVRKLDEAVASGLDVFRILKVLDAELISEQPGLGGEQGYERRAQKLWYRVKELYGVEWDKQTIYQALWQGQAQ